MSKRLPPMRRKRHPFWGYFGKSVWVQMVGWLMAVYVHIDPTRTSHIVPDGVFAVWAYIGWLLPAYVFYDKYLKSRD